MQLRDDLTRMLENDFANKYLQTISFHLQEVKNTQLESTHLTKGGNTKSNSEMTLTGCWKTMFWKSMGHLHGSLTSINNIHTLGKVRYSKTSLCLLLG